MALDAESKKDVILHGESVSAVCTAKGAMATVRREWRGIKDTAYDFYEWARMWGMLLMTFSKDLIPRRQHRTALPLDDLLFLLPRLHG